jgi:DNA-binding GntR family transcriptional regulator
VVDTLAKRDAEAARRAIAQDILIGGEAILERLQPPAATRPPLRAAAGIGR